MRSKQTKEYLQKIIAMRLLYSGLNEDTFSQGSIFLDNDFLSVLFYDVNAFENFETLTKQGRVYIDRRTRFEFLRDVHLIAQREPKSSFLANQLFSKTDQPPTTEQVSENALYLSYIYAHKKIRGAGYVDLQLAGITSYFPSSFLVTGNVKDFPECVFDTIGVINYVDTSQIRAFGVLRFNMDKYTRCAAEMESANTTQAARE